MIQGFYSAAVGAQQQMRNLDIRGNNVANVNTYGYKAQVPAFESLMYGMLDGIDGNQLPRGSGSALALTGTDLSAGAMEQTGRQLDFCHRRGGHFSLCLIPPAARFPSPGTAPFTLSPFQVEAEEDTGAEPVDTAGGDAEQTPALETRYYLSDGEGRQVLGTDGYPIVVTDPAADLPIGVYSIQYRDGLERAGSSRLFNG